MILCSRHKTTYCYSDPVSLCHNLLHLSARNTPTQVCLSSEIEIHPEPAAHAERVDCFGNSTAFVTIQANHKQLEFSATNRVRLISQPAPDLTRSPAWDAPHPRNAPPYDAADLEVWQFLYDSPYVSREPELARYAADSFPPGRPLLQAVMDLTTRIFNDFTYDPRATTIATPLNHVLESRKGVCQDFAHLEIGCLRSLGIPARYVSGYLLTTPPPGQPRLIGIDASHAWVSVYCPTHGWVDFDPTNNLIPNDRHVVLAWGRDYHDVSPIKGVILGGGKHSVSVSVDLAEEPNSQYSFNLT